MLISKNLLVVILALLLVVAYDFYSRIYSKMQVASSVVIVNSEREVYRKFSGYAGPDKGLKEDVRKELSSWKSDDTLLVEDQSKLAFSNLSALEQGKQQGKLSNLHVNNYILSLKATMNDGASNSFILVNVLDVESQKVKTHKWTLNEVWLGYKLINYNASSALLINNGRSIELTMFKTLDQ